MGRQKSPHLPADTVKLELVWVVEVGVGGREMSSGCFCSLGACGPWNPRAPADFAVRNVDRPSSASPLPPNRIYSDGHGSSSLDLLMRPDNSTTRREAIGLGVCLGLVVATWQWPSQAAETAPCELTVAPSGLAYCDKVVGSGPEAVRGQLIKAHYVGKLENGKVFDSSYSRGKPLTFRIGVGEVIKGWDEGILGGDGVPPMLAGGKRILKLPPELGYGTRGAGCRGGSCIIPPDSILLFDVEFIGRS